MKMFPFGWQQSLDAQCTMHHKFYGGVKPTWWFWTTMAEKIRDGVFWQHQAKVLEHNRTLAPLFGTLVMKLLDIGLSKMPGLLPVCASLAPGWCLRYVAFSTSQLPQYCTKISCKEHSMCADKSIGTSCFCSIWRENCILAYVIWSRADMEEKWTTVL